MNIDFQTPMQFTELKPGKFELSTQVGFEKIRPISNDKLTSPVQAREES
jgi:hypothetical protein